MFGNVSSNVHKVLSLVKYFTCDANISGFILIKEQKLIIFLISIQEHWRAHDDQIFKYEDGSWNRKDMLSYDQHDLLIAAAGVFIELSEDANLPCRWEEVSNKLQEIIADQNDDQFFNNFSFVAKTNADHSKLITKNKSYSAPWTSRICDLINKLKIELNCLIN